jgi:hypothetical protein
MNERVHGASEPAAEGAERHRLRVPGHRRWRDAPGPAPALPRQPRLLGSTADRRPLVVPPRGHVRQRRRGRKFRDHPTPHRSDGSRRDHLRDRVRPRTDRPAWLLDRKLCRSRDRAHSTRSSAQGHPGVGRSAGSSRHARLGTRGDRRRRQTGTRPRRVPPCVLHRVDVEPRRRPTGSPAHLRPKERPRSADHLANQRSAVRRRMRLGNSEPQPPATGERHRPAGARGERRQRSDDLAPLLASARRAATPRAARGLSGLGAWFPLSALGRVCLRGFLDQPI